VFKNFNDERIEYDQWKKKQAIRTDGLIDYPDVSLGDNNIDNEDDIY